MFREIIKSKSFIQFVKFILVGGTAFLIDFSVNLLIVTILHMEIKAESAIANVISYTVALTFNYLMSSRWSFKNEDGSNKGVHVMIKFIAVNLFNLTWSSLAIWYLVGLIHFDNTALIQPFTKILVTSFMTIVSFFLYKKFVFTKR